MSEAPVTTWSGGNLLPSGLLARALLWSRKKLLSEASKVGPPVECRTRMEYRNPCLGWASIASERQETSTPPTLVSPLPSLDVSRARRTGRTYGNVTMLSM